MPLINTQDLVPGEALPDNLQIYCGLDTMVTLEVLEAVQREYTTKGANKFSHLVYDFERAMQGPAMDMMLRGFRIDEYERRKGVELLTSQTTRVQDILDRFAIEIWGKPLNPRSPKQLLSFFYTSMKLPEQWTSKRGERKLSMDREALEKIAAYFYATPIVACILKIREINKQIETLSTEIDLDGRIRTSLNIAGTETGRWSSSKNAFGTGGNIFNIKKDSDYAEQDDTLISLRKIFIADKKKKLCVIDQEQAEARDIGFLCGSLLNDWTYLDVIESGDLHTYTARLIWPNDLPWTGDLVRDRAIAERKFYRHFSYRDMSKRGGHGSNYVGAAYTMAKHLKVPEKLMVMFQDRYFKAFPCIQGYHRWVAQELQTKQYLITPFGRKRIFFGRPNDDSTLREAVAGTPQSMTADRTSLGLYRIWSQLYPRVELLNQGYDSITFQFNEGDEAVIPVAMNLLKVPLRHGTREYVVPGDCKVGWNWGSFDARSNPNGLMKFKGTDQRTRMEGLHRVL